MKISKGSWVQFSYEIAENIMYESIFQKINSDGNHKNWCLWIKYQIIQKTDFVESACLSFYIQTSCISLQSWQLGSRKCACESLWILFLPQSQDPIYCLPQKREQFFDAVMNHLFMFETVGCTLLLPACLMYFRRSLFLHFQHNFEKRYPFASDCG